MRVGVGGIEFIAGEATTAVGIDVAVAATSGMKSPSHAVTRARRKSIVAIGIARVATLLLIGHCLSSSYEIKSFS